MIQDNKFDNNQENHLQYKEHGDFFIKFFTLRDLALEQVVVCKMNKTGVSKLFIAMYNLILWSNSQISKVAAFDKIMGKMDSIEKNIKGKKLNTAFNQLESLFYEISNYHSESELIPKVQVQEKDLELSSLEDKTRYALEAWRIVYAQK